MSRIGRLAITIPSGVTVEKTGNTLIVKGPKGELNKKIHPNMEIVIEENQIWVKKPSETKQNRSLHGLTRTLVANMVTGVAKGFEKKLEIIGIGYRAQPSGGKITLSLGYSHPIEYKAPEGVTFEADEEKKNIITIKGISKELVGETAAKVRSFRPPEPYKGKGIRYMDEYVARKAGKSATKG